MKFLLTIGLLLFGIQSTFAQIMTADTSVQTITYWDKAESQSYKIEQIKKQISGTDTLEKERISYMVDITVIDSTETSYTVDWFYHHTNIETDNLAMKALGKLNNDMIVQIKTNEFGVLQEVVNWKEVRAKIYDGIDVLMKEDTFKIIPNWKEILNQTKSLFSTKAMIQQNTIDDIQQFHFYHGGMYENGENYTTKLKSPNRLGGEPFDTDLIVWLDDVYFENNTYVIRSEQSINSDQLKQATFDYACKLSDSMGAAKPKIEDIPDMSNTIWIASEIHGTGWPMYSIKTKRTEANGTVNIEETTIDLQ